MHSQKLPLFGHAGVHVLRVQMHTGSVFSLTWDPGKYDPACKVRPTSGGTGPWETEIDDQSLQ